ncbi:MAG: M48 family metallopeptidase [Myxococcota bacterium]|nr:M48 family metallopeptidase [Myxococcota bacterium]
MLQTNPTEDALTGPRFKEISPLTWEHPADAVALKALRSLPGLDVLISRTIGRLNEANMKHRMTRGRKPATRKSHPRLFRLYEDILATFDITEEWPLYVVPMGGVNAGAVGMESPFLILSEEAALLADADIRVIIAHEVGHVLSGHVLYRTMMRLLLNVSWMALSGAVGFPLVIATLMAMVEWERKSELSADRASALAMGGSAEVRSVLERLNTGHDPILMSQIEKLKLNLSDETRQKITGALEALEKLITKHPPIEDRIAAVEEWTASAEFAAIMAGDYPRSGAENPWGNTGFYRLKHGAKKLSSVGINLSTKAGNGLIWLRRRAGLDT